VLHVGCKPLNEWSLFKSTPNEIALLAFLFGFTLAEPLTIEEQNVLGNFFFETGQILFTIASQRTLLEAIQKEQQKEASTDKDKDKDKDNQNHNHKKQADQTSEEKIQQQIEQMLNQNQELQRQIQQLQDQIDQLKQSR
jgi:predicted RNase H-like nuclease (RuvC/YqgF family)